MEQDKTARTVQKLIGLALIFMGFINILLSITGQYPLDLFTTITFLVGVILFVHGAGDSWHKWVIIALTTALALLFLYKGEVNDLSKVGLFWTVLLVIFYYTFISKERSTHEDPPDEGTGTGD